MIRERIEALKRAGYAPKTMLDVGAHIGDFTREFIKIFPACAPALIEPNPHCQDDLARLPFERHAVAASDANGTADLYLSRQWLQSTGSSLYRENSEYFDDETAFTQPVPKARIDDLFPGRRFDFVKIDTQGSELDVLAGGRTVLSKADYILIEVSLVDYNIGGAQPEAVFAQMEAMGFKCADIVDFTRFPQIRDNALLQMDVLFERTDRLASRAAAGARQADVMALAQRLREQGRHDDAILLFEHLAGEAADPHAIWIAVSQTHLAAGRLLEALRALVEAKATCDDVITMWPLIADQTARGSKIFNTHLNNGEIAEAEAYAAVIAQLTPGNAHTLSAAMGCNQALERMDEAVDYAERLRDLEPGHVGALTLLADHARQRKDVDKEMRLRAILAVSPNMDIHPLVRLRDFHESMSILLCRPLTEADLGLLEHLAGEVPNVDVGDLHNDPEWAQWVKHYQVLLGALDVASITAPTPPPPVDAPSRYRTATGQDLDEAGLKALADRLEVKTVFFAAADEKYVELYGRWYALSVLRHSDVSSLVVIHVIGGAGRLAEAARAVGVNDERLVFVGDDFDASAVTTECHDAPPKGHIALPVAHYQSVRFQRLGGLLDTLQRPVFVSDIDLLLQRGVEDLLEQWADADVVFNENANNNAAGSRITANLLLARPTANTAILMRWLRAYLDDRLSRDVVTRWIDQVALLLGRHHLTRYAPDVKLGTFDTKSDINNIMFETYQEHPFRFLSLYHGFDTSSLENDPRVLGAEPD
jgi:FkbM family methyltransferase